VLLFSATFPKTVKSFKDKWMKDPREINLMDELTLKGVTQFYAFVDEKQKVHCLNTLFNKVCTAPSALLCSALLLSCPVLIAVMWWCVWCLVVDQSGDHFL
jgi:ATP-dependent RNA helicase DDX6/DHH1